MRQRISPYSVRSAVLRKDYKGRQWPPYLCSATRFLAALATACVDLFESVRLALIFQILLPLLLLCFYVIRICYLLFS